MLLCRDLILPGTENFSHVAEILDLLLKLKRDPKGRDSASFIGVSI